MWIIRSAPLLGRERCKVLLAALQSGRFLAGCPLEILSKPKNENEKSGYASRNVLGGLDAFLAREGLYLRIISLDLGDDRCAIHELVLRLNCCDRLR